MRNRVIRRFLASTAMIGALTLALFTATAAGGLAVAQATPGPGHSVSDECGTGYYENSGGVCTPGPDDSPTGIRCQDGTYSHAATRQGACSRHGGIDDGVSGRPADDSTAAVVGSVAVGGLAAILGALALSPLLLFGSS